MEIWVINKLYRNPAILRSTSPLPFLPTTPKGNVLQRDTHTALGGPADSGRALRPRRCRLCLALNRRAVVGRLVPLDSRPHDCNWPHEFYSA
jgi:hypothetical protein